MSSPKTKSFSYDKNKSTPFYLYPLIEFLLIQQRERVWVIEFRVLKGTLFYAVDMKLYDDNEAPKNKIDSIEGKPVR